jgi:DNA repair ATPase RecN
MCSDLTEQLRQKESEIQELRRSNFELKKRITELENELEIATPALSKSRSKNVPCQEQTIKQLAEELSNLKIEKAKMMEGAVNAIMEKDNVICDL